MSISNDDIIKVFLRKAALNKQKQHSIQHLLELIDTYDLVRRGECKLKRTAEGFGKTDFHTIAELNYKELFDYAVQMKADKLNLPNVPECTGDPDYDVSKLRQWAINAQSILSEKPAGPEQKVASSTKRRRIIGWIFEGIIGLVLLVIFSYFFGLVTGIFIFAALLTIFHLLGWLDAIRSLITK